MKPDRLAARIEATDHWIAILREHDPTFVKRILIPRRMRSLRTLCKKYSCELVLSSRWKFAALLQGPGQ